VKLGSRVFPGRTRQPEGDQGKEGPQRHHSLAIAYALERLPAGERKIEILDLGAACGETLAFYSRLPCKIYFADFFGDLQSRTWDTEEEEVEAFQEACRLILPFPQGAQFDLVNSWDLFNYLEPGQIGALSEYLRAFVREQSLWTSLIWIHKRIPAQPQRFAIINEETVEYRPTSRSERTGPVYKEPALLKAMGSYRAGKSFLLRHGIQEYVFEPRHPVPSVGTDWGG
jgi:SAM-dependent methyltransferase